MATEIGRLVARFEADTSQFTAGRKGVESGMRETAGSVSRSVDDMKAHMSSLSKSILAVKDNIRSVKGDDIGFKTERITALKNRLADLTSEHRHLAIAVKDAGKGLAGISQETQDLNQALSTLSPRLGSLITSLSTLGPYALAAAAALAELAVVVGTAKGLFDLAQSVAAVSGELYDLSQQTGVSVETLAALDNLAKKTGGNLQSVSQSLVVFQGNMEDVGDANSKAGKTFRDLGVSVTTTEQTLRDTLKAISAMPEGFEQTNAAAELFGRRGGKQMLAILKESHGDIDQVVNELKGLGLANAEAARNADAFNDALVDLDTTLTGLKATIGNEIIPTITTGLQKTQKIIADNKDGFEALGFVAKGLTTLIGAPLLGAIGTLGFVWKAHQPVINAIKEAYEATAAAMQLLTGRIPEIDPNAIPAQMGKGVSGIDLLNQAGAAWRTSRDAGLKPFNLNEIFPKDKKETSAADPALALFKQLRGELQGLNEVTKLEELSIRLLDKEFKNISPTMKDQLTTLAKTIDIKRRTLEVDKEVERKAKEQEQQLKAEQEALSDFFSKQDEELRELKYGAKTAKDEVNDFRVAFDKLGGVLSNVSLAQARFTAAMIDSIKRMKTMLDLMRDTADLVPGPGGPVPALDPHKVLSEGELAQLGPAPAALPDFSEIRRKMRELGFELTDIFSQSIGDGFNRGIKSGLETLAQGLLRIVGDVFLKRMAEGLGDLLAGIGTSGAGGGGNWITKFLLPIVGGAVGGGIGGGSGSTGGLGTVFAGAFASGGTIPMGQFGVVHDNEKVVATPYGALVIPGQTTNNNANGNTYHININIPETRAADSYKSPRSRRELATQIAATLQGSLR